MKQLVEIPVSIAVLACDARIMAIWSIAAGEAAAIMASGNGSVVNRVGRPTGSGAVGVPGSVVPLLVPLLPVFCCPICHCDHVYCGRDDYQQT